MPIAREWTPAQDATIIRMRKDGDTWAAIGFALRLSRNTVKDRGLRLGAARGDAPVTARVDRETPEQRSLRVLKAIIDVPYFAPELGPPHRVCQAGVSRELPDAYCRNPAMGNCSYCARHREIFFVSSPKKMVRIAA